MTGNREMRDEIDKLERLFGQIAALTSRTDIDPRGELIDLRRRLAEQITIMGRAGDRLFSGSSDHDEYRALFRRMRSLAAMHQASWPAVMLGEDVEAFRASAQPMRDANKAFITWARQALLRMP